MRKKNAAAAVAASADVVIDVKGKNANEGETGDLRYAHTPSNDTHSGGKIIKTNK